MTDDDLRAIIRREVTEAIRSELGWLRNTLDVKALVVEVLREDGEIRNTIDATIREAVATEVAAAERRMMKQLMRSKN